MYKNSAERLVYNEELKLITAQQLAKRKQKLQKSKEENESNNALPNFCKLIDLMVMFEF